MKLLLLLSFSILFENFLCDVEAGAGSSNRSANCGGTFSGLQYPILSPNYPDDYPDDQDCVYVLKGSQSARCDQEFHLQFLDFQLEASKGCNKDYVRVGAGSIYCGNSIGIRKYKGQDGTLELIFHSDGNTTARGFRILVTTLPCADSQIDRKQDVSFSTGGTDPSEEPAEGVQNSYPVYQPEVKFVVEDEGRGDQPPSRLLIKSPSPSAKKPSENLGLPELERQDFHDENCGHAHSASNDDGIGSITSYLYLPPSPINRPVKITGAKTSALDAVANISSETLIPTEVAIEDFGDRSQIAEPPTGFVLPSRGIPPPYVGQQIHETREAFRRPVKRPQISSQFYQSTNRWNTYGTPNSVPSAHPAIPNNNFDPFANGDSNINNNNNNPVSPNCERDNDNPNYYPNHNNNNNNNNGNWNPGFNPFENLSPGSNVNFGNGNGFPPDTTGDNFDLSFGVGGNKNPGYFVTNGNYYPNNNFYSPADTTYYDTAGLSACCGTTYSSNSFTLASPGFPALIYSSSSYECQYAIERTSDNICQLQMNLKFFNFGSDDQFCAYGYIEIDGARLCGCKTGTNVTSSFDNIARKIITVKYAGYPRNKFSGFVIEVTQVSCSSGYLRFGNELQRGQNPGDFVGGYRRSYKRSTGEIDADERGGYPAKEKRDVGYFYQKPNSAALTTSQNLLLSSCRIFKFLNWVKAAKQVYLRSAQCSRTTSTTAAGLSSTISVIPIFPDAENSALINYPSSSNCEIVNLVDGTISSPYYPNSYSNNLSQCYRFYKAPGYCQLELAILDFDLENSTICRKDYVSFSGQKRRYCGTSLAGSRTIFDLTRSSFADLYFVTDSSGTGRGFRAGFTQISC